MDPRKNALAPIEFIVSVAGGLMCLVLLLLPATIFGSGPFLGMGEPDVCLTTDSGAVTIGGGGTNGARVEGLPPGGTTWPEKIKICQSHPSTWQRTLSALTEVPAFAFAVGFLFLTWRLIRYARREGFFVAEFALQLGRLGLYVLLGAVAVAVVQTTASTILLPTLVQETNTAFNTWIYFFHISWAVLFAGFGLLTINRVMAQTVPMQREIDATV